MKRIYLEVENHKGNRIRNLYFWKDDKHQGGTGNKFYLINTFRQQTFSSFIYYSTVQEKGLL